MHILSPLTVCLFFPFSLFSETAMGTRLDETSNAGKSYTEAVYNIGRLIVERLLTGYLMFDFLFSFSSICRQQRKLLTNVHNFTKKVIKERKQYIKTHGASNYNLKESDSARKKKKTALLDLLISAENDGLIDENGIQEEVDTFMFEVKRHPQRKFTDKLCVQEPEFVDTYNNT